jgi:putative ABC transport system ATP-binding protein
MSEQATAQSDAATAAQPKPGAAPAAANVLIRLERVGKTYQRGRERLDVLNGLSLDVNEGAFEALMGPSGSGKSTLLNLIAGLDSPSSGRVLVGGTDLGAMSEGARASWRAQNVGFIFQTYNLLPVLTALENVELPLLLAKLPGAERKRRAQTALRVVGLDDRSGHRPDQLSGGQQQRVAIARAIVTDPRILVADEPTGDLDRNSADEILDLLGKLNKDFNKTIMMVTHDPAAAERATITHKLNKGALT